VIMVEALRMHRNMMAFNMNNAEIGIYTILGIDPKNEEELNKAAQFVESGMAVVDLMVELGIGVVSGKEESQRKPEGEASGEGSVEGTELDTSDLD